MTTVTFARVRKGGRLCQSQSRVRVGKGLGHRKSYMASRFLVRPADKRFLYRLRGLNRQLTQSEFASHANAVVCTRLAPGLLDVAFVAKHAERQCTSPARRRWTTWGSAAT